MDVFVADDVDRLACSCSQGDVILDGCMSMCGANDGGATEVDAPLSHRMR